MSQSRYEETIETDFRSRMDYSGYLRLDRILAAQETASWLPRNP